MMTKNERLLKINDCSLCHHLWQEVCHNPDHPYNYIVGKEIREINEYGERHWRIPDQCKLLKV